MHPRLFILKEKARIRARAPSPLPFVFSLPFLFRRSDVYPSTSNTPLPCTSSECLRHRLSNCLNVFRQNRSYVVTTTRRFVFGVFATRRKLEENREVTERSELSPLAIVRTRVSSRAPIVEQGEGGAVEKDRRERCDRRRRRRERSSRTRGKRTTKRRDTVRVRVLIVFFRRVSLDQRDTVVSNK